MANIPTSRKHSIEVWYFLLKPGCLQQNGIVLAIDFPDTKILLLGNCGIFLKLSHSSGNSL